MANATPHGLVGRDRVAYRTSPHPADWLAMMAANAAPCKTVRRTGVSLAISSSSVVFFLLRNETGTTSIRPVDTSTKCHETTLTIGGQVFDVDFFANQFRFGV